MQDTVATRIVRILGLPLSVVELAFEEDPATVPQCERDVVDTILGDTLGFNELSRGLIFFPADSVQAREIVRRTRDLLTDPGTPLPISLAEDNRATEARRNLLQQLYPVS